MIRSYANRIIRIEASIKINMSTSDTTLYINKRIDKTISIAERKLSYKLPKRETSPSVPVVTGQVIGRIGSSGSASVPHVHFQYMDDKGKGLPALFWGARVNRLSDADLLSILGQVPDFLSIGAQLPDIREQNYFLIAGTYTMIGSTPLEYDIVTIP
jgi:hypothetical protein